LVAQRFESFVSKSTSIRPEHSSSNYENSFVRHVKFAANFANCRIRCCLLCDGVGIVWKRSTLHFVPFCLKWNEQRCQNSCTSVYWKKINGQQNLTGFVELFSLVFVDDLCSHQGRRQRGASGARPPFEICDPPFDVWPLVAPYIQYRILKMWVPHLVFGPSIWCLAPLLLNPGDGPGSHASYHHCGKVINVPETYFCEKILAGIRVSWVFQNYFNFVPMLESWWVDRRTYFWEKIMTDITFSWAFQKYFNCAPMLQSWEMDQKKSNCSCDVFLWKILGDITVSWVFHNYFNFVPMLNH